MDIQGLIESGMSFFREHTLWAVLALLVIGALFYWRPKGMFRLVAAGLVLGAIIYFLSFLVDLTSRGIDETQKFTDRPEIKTD